jgi:ParB-like chromosome segregation protein Spo0J
MRRDGMTMPCVVSSEKENDLWVIVDGFHRKWNAANKKDIRESLHNYLPCSMLNKTLEERVTSTVRHNLARGTHQVELSSKLVVFLKKHNWTDARIGKEIGMDADEVLRLKQITGLAEAFKDKEFSKTWE